MHNRVKSSAGVGAELNPLNHRGSVAQHVHLRPRQHDTDRAPQGARCEHRQHHLKLRAQARAESAAHERRHDTHIDRELAASIVDHRRGIELHRVVMLDRNVIFAGVAHCRGGECLLGSTARLRRREHRLDRIGWGSHRNGGFAPAIHIRHVRICLVLHPHQRRCKTRDLRRFGDDERDRLAVEHDLAVVERPERRSRGGRLIVVGLIVVRHGRAVLVRKHVEHTLDTQGGAAIDACDATIRDCRGYNAAVSKAWHVELGGIFGRAGDLGEAVDAGCGSADVRCHGCAQTIFLDDCDCGVPRAACMSARAMQRRARSILKVLCA
jgi:hypothetical protein